MPKIVTSKAFYIDGKIKNMKYTSIIKDLNTFFDRAVSDAKLFAHFAHGTVWVERTETTLYIGYLDVPNTNIVDVMRMVIS